jgi:uncharacterized protein (TIGR00297 family)
MHGDDGGPKWLVLGNAAGGCALVAAASVRGFRRESLSLSGAGAAACVGVATVVAGPPASVALLTMFLTSSAATRAGAARKRRLEPGYVAGGRRDWRQVCANGAAGAALALAYVACAGGPRAALWTPFAALSPWPRALMAALVAHFAAVNGDTWASELGVLAASSPRLLTSPWRAVPPGTNGGISLAGSLASVAGGAAVGAAAAAASSWRGASHVAWPLLPLGAAAGAVGSLIDSLLGATLQYSALDLETQMVVEHPGSNCKHIAGRDLLTGNQVNFLSVLATAVLGGAWFYYR